MDSSNTKQNKHHRNGAAAVRSLARDGSFFSSLSLSPSVRPTHPLFAALFIINNDYEGDAAGAPKILRSIDR